MMALGGKEKEEKATDREGTLEEGKEVLRKLAGGGGGGD